MYVQLIYISNFFGTCLHIEKELLLASSLEPVMGNRWQLVASHELVPAPAILFYLPGPTSLGQARFISTLAILWH